VWLLLGTGLHYTLEKHGGEEDEYEVKLQGRVRDKWVVTGIADVITSDGTIYDYKVTSAWSFLHGIKPEWEQQLNLYAFLAQEQYTFLDGYAQYNYDIKALKIIAILRDWQQSRARDSDDYPQQAIGVFDVPLWTEQEQYTFLANRIEAHTAETPAPCTDEERWASGECWAIMKGQNKRATKLHQSKEDAQQHWRALDGKPYWIEHRPPTYRRCEDYCPVSAYCKQVR
jgi:hypothetical protein